MKFIEKEKKITCCALVIVMFYLNSCALICGGKITDCQTTKPAKGQPRRTVRVAPLLCDIFLLPSIIALPMDFTTGAIYKPCNNLPAKNKVNSDTSNKFSIKINPLQLAVGEARFLFEIPLNKHHSIELIASYLFTNPKNAGVQGTGFKIGLGYRYYFKSGIYINPLLFYMHSNFTNQVLPDGYFDDMVKKVPPIPNDNYIKQVYSFQLQMGKKLIVRKHFILELFSGVGLRYRYYNNIYTYSSHLSVTNQTSNYVIPAVNAGINIGIK